MENLKFVPKTKYANKCAKCSLPIPAGSEALWNGDKGKESKNYHLYCNPNDAHSSAESSPRSQAESPGKSHTGAEQEKNNVYATSAPSSSDLSYEESSAKEKLDNIILARVHRAKQIVADSFNMKTSEISVDNQLVAVILSQIGAEVNIRKIQKNKLENMSKIGR